MKRTLIASSTAALGLACTLHVSAHHSFTAEYDIKKPISMTGTVTSVEWQNPHTWFYIRPIASRTAHPRSIRRRCPSRSCKRRKWSDSHPYESNTDFRQVFLDGRKPVEDPLPRWMGYSTGRWDGDTLVVDTVGFVDHLWLDAIGHPNTSALHVTERFRRPDAGHLTIETTIDDPGAYTKPFTYTQPLTLQADSDLLEYYCTENEKDVQHYQ